MEQQQRTTKELKIQIQNEKKQEANNKTATHLRTILSLNRTALKLSSSNRIPK